MNNNYRHLYDDATTRPSLGRCDRSSAGSSFFRAAFENAVASAEVYTHFVSRLTLLRFKGDSVYNNGSAWAKNDHRSHTSSRKCVCGNRYVLLFLSGSSSDRDISAAGAVITSVVNGMVHVYGSVKVPR